jgi:3-methyl-2-oxobutanoate hydroxymethyltransferase
MSPDSPPRSVLDLTAMKAAGRKIVMLTCYDATFARLIAPEVDVLLVGDSVNQVVAGHENTLSATLDQLIYHARAVRRGAPDSLLLVDLPFLSYQVSVDDAIRNVRALVERGIPVMAHLGLTPQSVHALGGYRVQGRDSGAPDRMRDDARELEDAGAFGLVLELVPAALAARISDTLRIPTVGIGAGAGCNGQVLVLYDMLGLNETFSPRFLKRFAPLAGTVREAARAYAKEVRAGSYPGAEHSFE